MISLEFIKGLNTFVEDGNVKETRTCGFVNELNQKIQQFNNITETPFNDLQFNDLNDVFVVIVPLSLIEILSINPEQIDRTLNEKISDNKLKIKDFEIIGLKNSNIFYVNVICEKIDLVVHSSEADYQISQCGILKTKTFHGNIQIVKFDLDEYRKNYDQQKIEIDEEFDILDLGYWYYKDRELLYEKPDEDFRNLQN